MSDYMEFLAGAAAKDDTNPPVEDNYSIRFAADGVERTCGWTKYVPAAVNSQSSVTLKMYFLDTGSGAGVARLDFQWFAVASSGVITDTGTATQLITVPNVANTVFSVNVDITTWLSSDPELFFMRIARDSSLAGDTFASDLQFSGARTL